MITDYQSLSGLDRVSILFSILGEGLALTLIKGLPEADVRKIRARVREMGEISPSIKKKVLDDFYVALLTNKLGEESKVDTHKPFGFLDDLTDEQLVALMSSEDPRIIALAIAQIPPERQLLVVNRISSDKKASVLIEVGNLNSIPLEAAVNIASQLQNRAKYLPKVVEFSRGGGESVAKILGGLKPEEEKIFMETLTREVPELAKEVRKFYFTFEDIFKLPDNILRDVLNAAELDTLAKALKGYPKEEVDKIVATLPQKKQAMFEMVEGAVPKRDVDAARKTLVDVVRQMEKDGRFNLQDLVGGTEMVT